MVQKENADTPVARTPWSTGRALIKPWNQCHDVMIRNALGYSPASANSRLALIGDSITECWRGTAICRKHWRCSDVPAVLNETMAVRWSRPVVLGIAADHTQHLLWRLMNGELSESMARDPKLISVVLIGTNNLGRGHSVNETVAGIDAVVRLLLSRTLGRVLVNGLFPRGDAAKRGKFLRTRGGES